jgi:outer membrane protein, multidrug efflux system
MQNTNAYVVSEEREEILNEGKAAQQLAQVLASGLPPLYRRAYRILGNATDADPSASVGADIYSQQNAKVTKVFPAYQVNAGELNLSVIWNLDFWGKYRRQTEAARAQLLATEWGQRAVLSSLVADVATAYFQLRALDSELEISKRTLASRQESLKLTQFLESHGSNSGLDVSQAQQLVYTASETIPDLERQIQQQENVLSILLGENPQSIPRGRPLTEEPIPRNVPAGLPSELLERRPDVRQAEEMMVAAKAQIGVDVRMR